MLVAISGSQGCGKSTVLNELKQRGYATIERKSSRSILNDWNVTLQEVNSNPELTLDFQQEITRRKYEDEMEAISSNEMWYTERTHADLFTYALAALGNNNDYSKWIDDYYNICLNYNQHYNKVYYLQGGLFTVEHDGVRGSNKYYSKMIDLTMLDITKQMIHPSKIQIITNPDLSIRTETIIQQTKYF